MVPQNCQSIREVRNSVAACFSPLTVGKSRAAFAPPPAAVLRVTSRLTLMSTGTAVRENRLFS
jgi:hypothetical protein